MSEFQRPCPFPFKKKRRRAKIKGYIGSRRGRTYFLMHKCRVGSDNNTGFKNKIRYTSYVSPENQISHIATNKGNIKRLCSIYNVLSIKDITLDSK